MKVGDIVVCINNSGFAHALIVGKEYEVIKVELLSDLMLTLKDFNYGRVYAHRFKLKEEESPKADSFVAGGSYIIPLQNKEQYEAVYPLLQKVGFDWQPEAPRKSVELNYPCYLKTKDRPDDNYIRWGNNIDMAINWNKDHQVVEVEIEVVKKTKLNFKEKEIPELIEIDGKKYIKEDVLKRLKELESVE